MHDSQSLIRDRFDELYYSAASFVLLPGQRACSGVHIRFNLDLGKDAAMEQFRHLCYAYEDSFDWSRLPLVFDSELPLGVVRWQNGWNIASELPIQRALGEFNARCDLLLSSSS